MEKFLGIIPARYQSTRFPGKPLALIGGKPMIQRVFERASQALDRVWIATDDQAIFETATAFGAKAVYTSPHHQSGTDRCAEAARRISEIEDFDVVINIQGDEPFIKPEQIDDLKSCFAPDVDIATLCRIIKTDVELDDPNKPKVVIDSRGMALYFSRAVIPYLRGVDTEKRLSTAEFRAHIGLYGYRKETLYEITQLPQGTLEKMESLEQLRWLENGYRIKVKDTVYESFGIDTPADLEFALKNYASII